MNSKLTAEQSSYAVIPDSARYGCLDDFKRTQGMEVLIVCGVYSMYCLRVRSKKFFIIICKKAVFAY